MIAVVSAQLCVSTQKLSSSKIKTYVAVDSAIQFFVFLKCNILHVLRYHKEYFVHYLSHH